MLRVKETKTQIELHYLLCTAARTCAQGVLLDDSARAERSAPHRSNRLLPLGLTHVIREDRKWSPQFNEALCVNAILYFPIPTLCISTALSVINSGARQTECSPYSCRPFMRLSSSSSPPTTPNGAKHSARALDFNMQHGFLLQYVGFPLFLF